MGSGSTKVASEPGVRKVQKGDDTQHTPHVNADEPDIPNMLVSLVRNETVLVSEGKSVATQTCDSDWASEGKCIVNGLVTYDIETVANGEAMDHGVSTSDVQDKLNGISTCNRERSVMGTNTVVTVLRKDKLSEPNEGSKDGSQEQKAFDGKIMNTHEHEISGPQQKLECSINGMSLERYGKYRVKVESDREKCTISAVAFLDSGDLVLIDRSNRKIKYVDSEFRYISAQDLSDTPWAVCARAVDVYVTIGNTRIQHLNVKDMLIEPVRTFEVKGRCLGICMFGEHIAVGLQIGEIHLLDTMGEKHGTIQLPVIDQDKPCNPWNISVSREENLLVTDSDSGVVFCVNKDSQTVFTFKEMSSPRGTAVDSHGNILVVGRDSDTGVVVKLLPRDWELQAMLHIEESDRAGSRDLSTWKELEFVPYCVDIRNDHVVVMGGIRESLKIMKLTSPTDDSPGSTA